MLKNDKEGDYRRRRYLYAFLAAAALITAISSFSLAGTSRPFRYYSDSGNTSFTYYTNLSGNFNLSAWGIDTDDPRCELQIGAGICINGSVNTTQGVFLNGTPFGSGAGLSSVPVVNLTRINGINNSGYTSLNFTFTNGTVMSVNVPDTSGNGSGSGSFNISNIDGWINVTNSTGVINFNLTNGYPIVNGSTTTCNSGTEYSTWNGTKFNCKVDGGLAAAVTSIILGLGINSSANPITSTGTLSINYTTSSLDGILRASDYVNLTHAGSSNTTVTCDDGLTCTVVGNTETIQENNTYYGNRTIVGSFNITQFLTLPQIASCTTALETNSTGSVVCGSDPSVIAGFGIMIGSPAIVQLNLSSGAMYNATIGNNSIVLNATNITAGVFNSGNYSFTQNLTLGSNLTIRGNVILLFNHTVVSNSTGLYILQSNGTRVIEQNSTCTTLFSASGATSVGACN